MGKSLHRILVVDDDCAIQEGLSETLRAKGYDVTTADNGAAALRILEQEPIDLVILDIFMPTMDGIETLFAIRKLHPSVLVYAISGGGLPGVDYLHAASTFGAAQVLYKPISPDYLIRLISSEAEPRAGA